MIQPRAEALMTASAIIRAQRDGRELDGNPVDESLVETAIASLWTIAGCEIDWLREKAKTALRELGIRSA